MSDIRADLEAAAKELEGGTEEAQEAPQNAPETAQPETQVTDQASVEEGSGAEESTPGAEKQVATDSEEDDPLPTTWSHEMRQHWKSTPAEVRKYIQERERQQHAYISKTGAEYGRLKRELGDVDKAMQPFEEELRASGMTKGQAVAQLISERTEMMRDPKTFLKRFADLHKIDLLKAAMEADQEEPIDVRQARFEVERQKRELQAKQGTVEQQRAEIERQQIASFVESWGAQKPHFGAVREAMAQILPEVAQSYPYLSFQEQLELTYSSALKHPNFAHLSAPKQVPQAVKKAASGVAGVSGAPTRQPEPSTIREALLQAAKETGFL